MTFAEMRQELDRVETMYKQINDAKLFTPTYNDVATEIDHVMIFIPKHEVRNYIKEFLGHDPTDDIVNTVVGKLNDVDFLYNEDDTIREIVYELEDEFDCDICNCNDDECTHNENIDEDED